MYYRNYDALMMRDKFATLIARLHEVGFGDDMITLKILREPFFSCFENDNYDAFMNMPIEDIITNVFGKRNILIDYGRPLISEYYWAGMMYFSLLMYTHVPLERSFLVYPLREMLLRYNPYHEMPYNAFQERYLEDEKKTSIINILKKKMGFSMRAVSFLTGINENTLNSFIDNEKLFKTDYSTITLLSRVFACSPSTFKKESSFSLFPTYILKDESEREKIVKKIKEYYLLDENTPVITDIKTHKELLEFGKNNKVFIYLPDMAVVKYRGKLDYTFLAPNEIELLTRGII